MKSSLVDILFYLGNKFIYWSARLCGYHDIAQAIKKNSVRAWRRRKNKNIHLEQNNEVYMVQENDTQEVILVTKNRNKALDFLSKKGYTVSGFILED